LHLQGLFLWFQPGKLMQLFLRRTRVPEVFVALQFALFYTGSISKRDLILVPSPIGEGCLAAIGLYLLIKQT
jgi:hypothetical protein